MRINATSLVGWRMVALLSVASLAAAADVPVMRLPLASGADPLLTTNTRTTPLMAAAGLGRNGDACTVTDNVAVEAAKLLVELGADVNAANAAGETALHGPTCKEKEKV